MKEVTVRVKDGLEKADREDLRLYLEAIRANARDYVSAARRAGLALVVTVVAFELLSKNVVKDFAIGPLTLTNSSLVRVFLPALAMYFLTDGFVNDTCAARLRMAHDTVFELWCPAGHKNGLDGLLRPPQPLWFSADEPMSESGIRTREETVELVIGNVITVVVIFAVLGFEIQAYYDLAHQLHAHDALLWISGFLTVMMFVGLVIYIAVAPPPTPAIHSSGSENPPLNEA